MDRSSVAVMRQSVDSASCYGVVAEQRSLGWVSSSGLHQGIRGDPLDPSENTPSRLSRIETLWSVVCEAHDDSTDRHSAQELLLHRYGLAIKRYLLAAMRDKDLAEEVFQEFALKFVRGDLKSVAPEKGKFRSYVKTVLANLIRGHHRKSARQQRLVNAAAEDANAADDSNQSEYAEEQQEQLLLSNWRDELLTRTWQVMETAGDSSSGQYFLILKYRVENPAESYEQLSQSLSSLLGRQVKSGNARILVHRAREKFAKTMIGLVTDSLQTDSLIDVEEELAELGLLDYCRDTLAELKQSHADQKPQNDE